MIFPTARTLPVLEFCKTQYVVAPCIFIFLSLVNADHHQDVLLQSVL